MWLVGAGYWGSKLLESLKKFNIDVEIIDIKNGQSIDDITDFNPVILATPLWQHHEQTLKLLAKGHDIYVEKPMATTADEILDIQRGCADGQLVMVGHIFCHHPQLHTIKTIIENGSIGQLTHISSKRLNWGIYQTKTDPVLSLATHDISIITEFVNDSLVVESTQQWNYSKNTQSDRVFFSGRGGAVTFDCDVSWHWPIRTRETVFIGDAGQIQWNQDTNIITVFGHSIRERRAVPDPSPKIYVYNSDLSPLEHEIKHWVDCVKTRTTPLTGITQALDVAKVIDQISQCRPTCQ